MANTKTSTKIAIFQKKEVRKILHKKEWWFVIEDVVVVLTDSVQPKGYIKDMREYDKDLSKGWGKITISLSIDTTGVPQKLNCANAEGILRIIQAIPSPKAESFKIWLKCEEYRPIDEEMLSKRHREVLMQKINKSFWWHVIPKDPNAYEKRGKFLASTYTQAEFYGRPNNIPEKVNITNPLCENSELLILKKLFPQEYQSLFYDLVECDGENWYQRRIDLDEKIHQRAKKEGYDAVVLLGKGAIKQIALNKKPRSIELNLCV